jgi:hypothetical protein
MQISLDQQVALITGTRSSIGAEADVERLFIDGGMSLYPEFRGNG